MRFTFMLLLIALSGVTAQGAPIEIMVEDAAAPWSNPDGTGIANAIVKASFDAAGTDVRLSVVPYARCKAAVMGGQVAGCFSMSWEPQLNGKVVFADQPLYSPEARIYVRRSHAKAFSGFDSVPRGAVLGVVNGYEYPEQLAMLKKARGVVFEVSNTESILMKKLTAGRIDMAVLMLDGQKTEETVLREAGADPSLVVFAFSGGVQGSYLGFSTQHPDAALARSRFNAGFQKITKSGLLKSLLDG